MKLLSRIMFICSMISVPFLGTVRVTQGAEILAASVLAPIVAPIAKEMLSHAAKGAHKAVAELAKKKTQCKLCNFGLKCKTKTFLSGCKSHCTSIYQVGGYEIRIRFGEGWSIAECVRKGVRSNIQSSQGKGNTKSIAVYSQKDLDYLLDLISIKMAAHKIVDTGARSISSEDLKKSGLSREEAVKEAKETIDTIINSIDEAVSSGRFGNQ